MKFPPYSVSKYSPALFDVHLNHKNDIINITDYGQKVLSILNEIPTGIKNIHDVFIKSANMALEQDIFKDYLFMPNELDKKTVYIFKNTNAPISDRLGNVYISEEDANNPLIDLILIHEAAHYFYTNLLSLKLQKEQIDEWYNELHKNLLLKSFKYGNYDYSLEREVEADFFSLLFLKDKGLSLNDYLKLIKSKDDNELRGKAILSIVSYLNENSLSDLLELYRYIEIIRDMYSLEQVSEHQLGTMNINFHSIVPIDDTFFKKNTNLIRMVSLFTTIKEISDKENSNDSKISKRFKSK